jgi:DNA-binding Lrp family transcriptional regulator
MGKSKDKEIQRKTGASPTTVNNYLKEWTQDGKVSKVRLKYQITQQGLDELKRLTTIVERKNRLQTQMVYLTVIPTKSAQEVKPIFEVGIGSKAGTNVPPGLKTQERIRKDIEKWVPLVEELWSYTNADPLEVRVVIGSPPPFSEQGERTTRTGHPNP